MDSVHKHVEVCSVEAVWGYPPSRGSRIVSSVAFGEIEVSNGIGSSLIFYFCACVCGIACQCKLWLEEINFAETVLTRHYITFVAIFGINM